MRLAKELRRIDCAAQTAVCFQNACTTCSQHPGACQKDLYTRLGGDTGVDALMTQLITNELADVAIASYFFAQTAATTPAGSPTTAQLRLCLRHLLKGNTTDPKIDDYAVTAKNGGFACRSMAAAHACKHVASRDFDKFVATFSSTLLQMVQTNRYNVTSAEQASLTTLFAGTKTDVVDPTRGANDTGFPSPH